MAIDKLTDALFWDWQRLLQSLGIEQVAAQQAFAHLVAAYSSPGRYYHTFAHIHHVLSTIQALQFHTKDLTTVQLAAWFHDVVYALRLKITNTGAPTTLVNFFNHWIFHQA